jgi:ribosomal protein L5
MARLYDYYKESVMPELTKQFGYKSVMEVPRIEKITLNMGVGEAVGDKKVMDHAVGRHDQDCRPEAGCHQGAQVHCDLQDS